MDNLKLLEAKEAIFSLIAQFQRPVMFTSEDNEMYIYDYCESALEAAFEVLGIEDDRIKLLDFCQMWEDNTRALRAIKFPGKPYHGPTADLHYNVLKDDYAELYTYNFK